MQFIQLDEGEGQALEVAVVQQDTVGAHAFEPAGDGRLGVAGVAYHDGYIDTFGHQPEYHLDAVGCCFQVIEWSVAAAGEIPSAPLAAKVLNVVLDTPFAVADEGMYLVIGDAEVVALRIETGITGGVALFLASSCTLALGIGLHLMLDRTEFQAQAVATVWAILGRSGFPAQSEARFGFSPPAPEERSVDLP